MAKIMPNMCQKEVENYLKRIDACNTSHGGHINDVGLHTECQTFKLYNKKKYHGKKIFYMCFIYVCFCNHDMDNPI